ncbi:DUF6867 family protein [Varunaivibrio sulfuroxidans]|uniref:DUF6867 domain-containing protein n=1 Tax=Varunaivibrio sulfuroxidans TaxID=1773489 RepID=A0A4R3JEM3_9PROT|nr:hypothetical protein [Varunaivibrio sulfuroxidans]TCS64254.1 hypothetical protein EDD55_102296 [Varunaivibrio sulfuroxidans]WES31308.1 hypothetical protein P3M64_02730 [Varunaivibrio sulfuroxidans]
MDNILGTTFFVYIGMNIFLIGFAAYMTGQAIATTWRPMWQILPYSVLLGLASRFLTYALFDGPLLHLSGFLIGTLTVFAMCCLGYFISRATVMVNQYPWLYRRNGLFGWSEKTDVANGE